MTLKCKDGGALIPVAAISKTQISPGFLFCQRADGNGRFSYTGEYLLAAGNSPEEIDGYFENLAENFQKWLEEQTSKYGKYGDNYKKTYRWEEGDIPPIWYDSNDEDKGMFTPDQYVDQPQDTRSPDDYYELPVPSVGKPRKKT